ncbi:hypothetical protein MW887_002178 [Aspergillus wentii]|nr:hypothetical protein MW887_002178 [Aspergillus wentii]
MSTLDLYIGFGYRRGNEPLNWMLILASPHSERCTWYYISGPIQQRQYTLQVQNNRKLSSLAISDKEKVGCITAGDAGKVMAAARDVPVQMSQVWVTAVLGKLENKGLVSPGTWAYAEGQIEYSCCGNGFP